MFVVLGLKGALLSVTSPTTSHLEATVSRGLRRVLSSGVVLTAIIVGVLSVGFVSSAVAGDTCVNAAVRVQTGSTALPDCRAYEMVSASYKEGFPLLPSGGGIGFTEDGLVSYQSRGAFAGNALGSPNNLYHATRSVAGWVTSSLDPPGSTYDTSNGAIGIPVAAETVDLRWSVWSMVRRDGESGGDTGFWLRGSDGAFTRVGDYAGFAVVGVGVSAGDLTHLVLTSGGGTLLEYVGTENSGPPRAVSRDNNGQASPGDICLRDVSSDVRVITFSSGCNGLGTPQVWARVGGSASVAVSGSECTRAAGDVGGLCNGVSAAAYAGAAADGSRVFFTTSQQLVNGDIDQTDDLYACDIPTGSPAPVGSANPCASLTQVSGAATDAQVENAVAVSEDGSRVYFVAQGVLADNLDVRGVGARAGKENLYMWEDDAAHPAGHTRYVARLGDPGSNDLTRAQMTPDGRYLLFVTANKLAAGDTDNGIDVYRYDAVTHTIVRVSASVAGGGGGNAPGLDASVPAKSAMSADGATVIFDTAEALSPSDSNGVNDVYGWRDGQVWLISAGGGSAVGVTPSDRDIFFITDEQVLGADRDANTDIYDARAGGGFAPAQTPSPCFGDQCQGERSQPPSFAGPSVARPGGDGSAGVAPVFSVRTVSAAQRRTLATTGKIGLMVTANAAGTIDVRAAATIAGRSVTVGSGHRALAAPGKVAVALTLSKSARAQLASRGRLTVKIAVRHSKVALDRSVTLKLVRAKAHAKRSARGAQRSAADVGEGRS